MTEPFKYLKSAQLTDVGRRRLRNEDALLRLPAHGVFCIADGMGGVQGGAFASQATVDALGEAFTDSPDAPFALTARASARLAARALNAASGWIKQRADALGFAGCGSTAVVLAFDRVDPSRAAVLHAGDSRAYRLRRGELARLSTDHSVAAAVGLEDDRDLPAAYRGVITRAVGLADTVALEVTDVDVQPGDLFLLCSDGLNQMVPDDLILARLSAPPGTPLKTLARALVEEALRAGGEDNVSVVLVRVADALPAAPTQAVPPETLALEQAGEAGEAERPAAPAPSAPADSTIRFQLPAAAVRRTASTRLLIGVAFLLAAVVIGLLLLQRSCGA